MTAIHQGNFRSNVRHQAFDPVQTQAAAEMFRQIVDGFDPNRPTHQQGGRFAEVHRQYSTMFQQEGLRPDQARLAADAIVRQLFDEQQAALQAPRGRTQDPRGYLPFFDPLQAQLDPAAIGQAMQTHGAEMAMANMIGQLIGALAALSFYAPLWNSLGQQGNVNLEQLGLFFAPQQFRNAYFQDLAARRNAFNANGVRSTAFAHQQRTRLRPSRKRPQPVAVDQSVRSAVDALPKTGRIGGARFEKFLIEATEDKDASAASVEYQDLANWVEANWNRMSPDARQKWRVYEKYALAAQAEGRTGIRQSDYNRLKGDLKEAGYQDASIGREIERLKDKSGTIDGDDVVRLVRESTSDTDAQAAGREFDELDAFARENWHRFSPEARQRFDVYRRVVAERRKAGKTGIPQSDWKKMIADMEATGADETATKAIAALDKASNGGTISGAQMQTAILDATGDKDGAAASTEFDQLKEYVDANWDRMSPDAREKWRTYQRFARNAQWQGKTGISSSEYERLKKELAAAGYQDASTAREIERLNDKSGPITRDDMQRLLVDGTTDSDGHAAKEELADIERFVQRNWARLSPEAQQQWRIYERYASEAKEAGTFSREAFNKMTREIGSVGYLDESAGLALEKLRKQSETISGSDLISALEEGIRDKDGRAASMEFADVRNFVNANWSRLSPDARRVFQVYQRVAAEGRGDGKSGLESGTVDAMLAEMRRLVD